MFSEELFKILLAKLNIKTISAKECIGYKTPIFLNGSDVTENYELSDIELYWDLFSQLYKQIRDLPDGTPISSIKIVKR